jgi:TetR/AcrR family transcriptional regulator, tetracycline repressor protein
VLRNIELSIDDAGAYPLELHAMAVSRRPQQRRPSPSHRKLRDLTREKVLEAGLKLIDRKSADAITMRCLADAVGVTPMALYNHFSSKRELLRAIAEHVIGRAEFDGRHADWHEQVRHCFRTLRSICLERPALPRLLEVEGVAPASVFAPMEVTLRALEQAGLDAMDSLRTYFLLVSFTLGQASYQTSGPFPDLEPSEKVRAERIAGRGYRATERLDMPKTWDFDATFEFGLTLILLGVEGMISKSVARSKRRG